MRISCAALSASATASSPRQLTLDLGASQPKKQRIKSLVETADDYCGVVAQLNADWRVVESGDQVQWILQRRGSPKMSRRNDWRGRSYCRTSEALIRATREYAGRIDPAAAAILNALPALIEVDSSAASDSPPNDAIRDR